VNQQDYCHDTRLDKPAAAGGRNNMPELGQTSMNAALKQENDELRARVAELEQKLKDEAEGHEGWEQEHLRQDGIRCALLRQIMGLCDPQNPIYQIAKQAIHIEP
jgi:bifunctional pyridoxal-dependent enzyme with beta-cystathionase and maltose regulon repressor activities